MFRIQILKKILENSIFDKNSKHFSLELRTKIGKSMISGKTGFMQLMDPKTKKVTWGFYAPINVSQWSIAVYVNEDELNGPIKKVFLESTILFGIAILIVIILLTIIISKGIKPLKQLQNFSKEIRDGNYNARISLKTNDEISDLADDLNIMSKQLKKRENQLKEINTNLEQKAEKRTLELQKAKESTDRIIDTSPMPIAITDRISGEVIRTNRAMADFHKTTIEEVYKTTTHDWYWNNGEKGTILSFVEENGKLINYEMEGKCSGLPKKDGYCFQFFPLNI